DEGLHGRARGARPDAVDLAGVAADTLQLLLQQSREGVAILRSDRLLLRCWRRHRLGVTWGDGDDDGRRSIILRLPRPVARRQAVAPDAQARHNESGAARPTADKLAHVEPHAKERAKQIDARHPHTRLRGSAPVPALPSTAAYRKSSARPHPPRHGAAIAPTAEAIAPRPRADAPPRGCRVLMRIGSRAGAATVCAVTPSCGRCLPSPGSRTRAAFAS